MRLSNRHARWLHERILWIEKVTDRYGFSSIVARLVSCLQRSSLWFLNPRAQHRLSQCGNILYREDEQVLIRGVELRAGTATIDLYLGYLTRACTSKAHSWYERSQAARADPRTLAECSYTQRKEPQWIFFSALQCASGCRRLLTKNAPKENVC